MQTQWRGGSGESTNIMGDFRNYPEIVFRPPLFGDEKNPTFSNCTLPIVLYKSHEDNFYHLTVSLIPQLYSFLTEHMVNTDVTYVVRTRTRRLCHCFARRPPVPPLPVTR